MREFHAIVSVTAVDREQADAFFERIERDAMRFGGNLTCLDSVHPDTGGEPHPRLEAPWCTCGAKTMQGHGHAYDCPARARGSV
jgi:hypothetical protein